MDTRCQQFTSFEISNTMLDMLNYKSNLYGKKVLENSCGEGNILGLVVERYITSAIDEKKSIDVIKQGLENDIYGVEIVEDTYNKCLDNLNVIIQKYGMSDVKWNILKKDVLTKPFNHSFDYIIGNPPYIAYRNLELEVRQFIKNNYKTCKKGNPDYCYAFIENAIDYLNISGKMAYLIPNSIFKNVFGNDLRKTILPHLVKIYDYPNCKLFEKALTSSSIMILEKDSEYQQFTYCNVTQNYELNLKKSLLMNKWNFNIPLTMNNDENVRFGQLFRSATTIATQRNNIFVINNEVKKKYSIENGVLRKAISPRNQQFLKKESIIFPYRVRNGKVYGYTENEFKKKYPNAYNYLQNNKDELVMRDSDDKAQWFEYGRSQAIQNMNMKKLLVSTVVTNVVKIYDIGTREIPYSGIYIISNNQYDLSLARKILESDRFLEYVKGIGTPASGSSLRITANDINNYTFKVGDF